MLPLDEICRKANALVSAQGDLATIYAHDSAIDCLAVDDLEGYMIWQRILCLLATQQFLRQSAHITCH
jgi:hypothetical protein